jgi:hypothetical protein
MGKTIIGNAWAITVPRQDRDRIRDPSLNPEDSAAMSTLRSPAAGMKGKFEAVAARGPF